ncbi:uncharacterized protein LOC124312660 [Daphnia pulicaria]|uniref:uncharacterized protein LOC124312660 n=1 Tax=Daphnia pulicaria TaxID=35523 RepID=UPI001EEA8DD6|nr:uncharacterized protein LOC124312660 [Daphnia pulicaria]
MDSMVSLMFELLVVLLFGVRWFCCHYPVKSTGPNHLMMLPDDFPFCRCVVTCYLYRLYPVRLMPLAKAWSIVSLMFELLMVLMFGVQWFCSPIPIEFVHNCSSTSHLNVSFIYVGVRAVYAVLKSRAI